MGHKDGAAEMHACPTFATDIMTGFFGVWWVIRWVRYYDITVLRYCGGIFGVLLFSNKPVFFSCHNPPCAAPNHLNRQRPCERCETRDRKHGQQITPHSPPHPHACTRALHRPKGMGDGIIEAPHYTSQRVQYRVCAS